MLDWLLDVVRRFAGQTEWFCTDSKGKFSFDFVNTPDSTIEEIDLSRTLINQAGLHNLSNPLSSFLHTTQYCTNLETLYVEGMKVQNANELLSREISLKFKLYWTWK